MKTSMFLVMFCLLGCAGTKSASGTDDAKPSASQADAVSVDAPDAAAPSDAMSADGCTTLTDYALGQLTKSAAILGTTCTGCMTADGGSKGTCANGCTWNEKPNSYTLMSCPEVAPPVCKNPLKHGDCWGPPNSICGFQDGDVFGCSPDFSHCCVFNCVPCGWTSCQKGIYMGVKPPKNCGPITMPTDPTDPAWNATCPPGLLDQIKNCKVCDGAMICPPGTPTETVGY